MRHKYDTRGIVLGRSPAGEANAHVLVLTSDLGLVRARAQGVRRPGAKLASALQTFAESDLVLIRGKEGWRLSGAVLAENWFSRLADRQLRERAARTASLLLRLVAGEAPEAELYPLLRGYLSALCALPAHLHDAAEIRAALALLSALGFDAGEPFAAGDLFAPGELARIGQARSTYVARVNHDIAASGL
jgi:DNA repair protein RecO